MRGRAVAVSLTALPSTPTWCCRSRRSPKPPGTFVNCEGLAQAFNGVAPPLGETRPAWKVLRVLGSLLGLPGFAQDSIEAVRA